MQQEQDSIILSKKSQCVVAKIQEGSQFYAAKYQKHLRPEEYDIIMNIIERRPDHIIKIKSINQYQGHNTVYEIIMELGQENLYQHIKQNNFAQQNLDYKLNFCLQTLKGVEEIQGLGYIHGNIKPEHYILNRHNELKLIDFGLVKQINAVNNTEGIGTAQYMAPEITQDKSNDPPVDIWALGLIIYLILTQKDFFIGNSIHEIKKQIAQIQQSEIDERIQNEINNRRIQNLLLGMLRIEPRQRIQIRNAVDQMSQIIKESQLQKDEKMDSEQQIKCNDKKMLEKQQNSQKERNQNQLSENIVVLSEQENEENNKVSQILQKDQTFKQKVSDKIQSQEEIEEINKKKIELEQLIQKENSSENSVVLSEQETESTSKAIQILQQKIEEIKIEFDQLIQKENPCKNRNVLLNSETEAIREAIQIFQKKKKEINQKIIEIEQKIQIENPQNNTPDHDSTQSLKDFFNSKIKEKKKTNNEVEKSKKSFKEFESLRDSEDIFSLIYLIESILSNEQLRQIIENFSKSKKHQTIDKLNEELLMSEILIEDYFQKQIQSKNRFDQFFLLSDYYRQYLRISQIMLLQNIIDQNQIQFIFDYLKLNQSFNLEDLIAFIDFTESKVVQDESKLDQKISEKLSQILNLEKKFNKLIVELIRLLGLLQQNLQQQVNQNKHINEQFLVQCKKQSAINKQDHIAILSKMLTYSKQLIQLHEKELSEAQSSFGDSKQDLQLLCLIARLETLKLLNFYWEMLFKQDQSSSENQTLLFDEKYRKQLAMITDQKNPNYRRPKAPY